MGVGSCNSVLILPVFLYFVLFIVSAKDAEPELWKQLWFSPEAEKLKDEAYSTTFVGGVVNGTLKPDDWAAYNIQDAYYVQEVSNIWARVWGELLDKSDKSNDSQLIQYAQHELLSWRKDSSDMLRGYSISQYGGVVPKNPVTKYVNFIRSTSDEDPYYMLVAIYACVKLWPYLAKRCLNDTMRPNVETLANPMMILPSPAAQARSVPNNPYLVWCDDNKDPEPTALQKLMQIYYVRGKLTLEKVNATFVEGMRHEIDFFNNPM